MRYDLRIIGVLVLMLAVAIGGPATYVGAQTTDKHPVQDWLVPATTSSKAIGLKVWAQKPDGQPVTQGDPVVIKGKVGSKGYVLAVCVASNGDAVVLFPNKQNPSGLLEAGTDFVLFGPESGVKLTFNEQPTDAKVVFYVSETPMDLGLSQGGEDGVVIPAGAKKERDGLTEKIKALAKNETFNTKVLAFNGGTKGSVSLMGLPTAIKSSRPEGIVGIQGKKDKASQSGKE